MSPKKEKLVYYFGGGKAEGRADMKNELGGKGANLAEMVNLGVPVPAGFTIPTSLCMAFLRGGRKFSPELKAQVEAAIRKVEREMGARFGAPANPLLLSVRSGARKSMPGMMETVLNIGLNDITREGLIAKTKNPRFVYDAQRRLMQMYSDVVMEKAAGIEPAEGMGIRQQLDREMEAMKKARGVKEDTELTAEDLKQLIEIYRKKIKEVLGRAFPEDPMEQLWGAIGAVFSSWNGKRAIAYRRIEGIPEEWGTAVNVQAMVFGNMGETSATGVAFTRSPSTGENYFYGEYLVNAQGEDVVAGIRTPSPINEQSKSEKNQHHTSLEKGMPKLYAELFAIQKRLERHYRDMLDIEFTIQEGRLWMLQCRVGKRNGPAAVRMAVDMFQEKMISAEEAVSRVTPDQLDEVLHPIVDPAAEKVTKPIAKGLPAGPGGACGVVVFTAEEAVKAREADKKTKVILVREETNPEDVDGMRAAEGILTARGGMTSHAALVARGWGKCCIVGAGEIEIDVHKRVMTAAGVTIRAGEYITLNGTKGYVYAGQLPLVKITEDNPFLQAFQKLCDKVRKSNIRTNADTPADAAKARAFGAEGIGLFRTEHMFYGEGSDKPLAILRKLIMAQTSEERRKFCDELFPFVKAAVKGTLEAMSPYPVTIRLLDPPLHEFVPEKALAKEIGITLQELEDRAKKLREVNPMMGHRGCRLGVTYPEMSEMQIRAVLEATAELLKAGKKVTPEIMVPVTCAVSELRDQKAIFDAIYAEVKKKFGLRKFEALYGTMIEIPRAALKADEMAEVAEFFSYGTNDLTQMTFGFSRDDVGAFMPAYLAKGLLPADPFQTLDQSAVGELIAIGVERGRATRPGLKIGICGEHGGDPASVHFCHRVGMNYVSCSPFRVPIARLAAAQAALKYGEPGDMLRCSCCEEPAPKKKAAKGKKPVKAAKKAAAPKAKKAAVKKAPAKRGKK